MSSNTQVNWYNIPWKERKLIGKLQYACACAFFSIFGLLILWTLVNLATVLLKQSFSGLFKGSPAEQGAWFAQNATSCWWFWLTLVLLFLQRWFRILLFIVTGGAFGAIIASMSSYYSPAAWSGGEHVTTLEGFLIGAAICTIVSTLCTFAPRPHFRRRPTRPPKNGANGATPTDGPNGVTPTDGASSALSQADMLR